MTRSSSFCARAIICLNNWSYSIGMNAGTIRKTCGAPDAPEVESA
jgi:hypothetical protein